MVVIIYCKLFLLKCNIKTRNEQNIQGSLRTDTSAPSKNTIEIEHSNGTLNRAHTSANAADLLLLSHERPVNTRTQSRRVSLGPPIRNRKPTYT